MWTLCGSVSVSWLPAAVCGWLKWQGSLSQGAWFAAARCAARNHQPALGAYIRRWGLTANKTGARATIMLDSELGGLSGKLESVQVGEGSLYFHRRGTLSLEGSLTFIEEALCPLREPAYLCTQPMCS